MQKRFTKLHQAAPAAVDKQPCDGLPLGVDDDTSHISHDTSSSTRKKSRRPHEMSVVRGLQKSSDREGRQSAATSLRAASTGSGGAPYGVIVFALLLAGTREYYEVIVVMGAASPLLAMRLSCPPFYRLRHCSRCRAVAAPQESAAVPAPDSSS
jgi:hypothetical protein